MKKLMFCQSPFWDAVIRNSIFLELAIMFIAFIKVVGDNGLGNVTFSNVLYAIAITVPLAIFTATAVVVYEQRKGK